MARRPRVSIRQAEPEVEAIEEVQREEDALVPVGGRPSLYRSNYAKMAKMLCARGATDKELAEAFDVSTNTILYWQTAHPEFGDAIRSGKCEVFDPLVERALAQRALGYAVDVEEVKVVQGQLVRVTVRKHFPPETAACVFWLKNRMGDKWKDSHTHEHIGVPLDQLTADELRQQIMAEAAALGLMVHTVPDNSTEH